jgi:hypothetical protein
MFFEGKNGILSFSKKCKELENTKWKRSERESGCIEKENTKTGRR